MQNEDEAILVVELEAKDITTAHVSATDGVHHYRISVPSVLIPQSAQEGETLFMLCVRKGVIEAAMQGVEDVEIADMVRHVAPRLIEGIVSDCPYKITHVYVQEISTNRDTPIVSPVCPVGVYTTRLYPCVLPAVFLVDGAEPGSKHTIVSFPGTISAEKLDGLIRAATEGGAE